MSKPLSVAQQIKMLRESHLAPEVRPRAEPSLRYGAAASARRRASLAALEQSPRFSEMVASVYQTSYAAVRKQLLRTDALHYGAALRAVAAEFVRLGYTLPIATARELPFHEGAAS